MPRISLKTLLLLVAILALFFVPLGAIVRHSATWGPAERTADMLSELYSDACSNVSTAITVKKIDNLLELPKYDFLRQYRTHEIELRDGELAWFRPNNKYSIGLHENGQKMWIVNGVRTGN